MVKIFSHISISALLLAEETAELVAPVEVVEEVEEVGV